MKKLFILTAVTLTLGACTSQEEPSTAPRQEMNLSAYTHVNSREIIDGQTTFNEAKTMYVL